VLICASLAIPRNRLNRVPAKAIRAARHGRRYQSRFGRKSLEEKTHRHMGDHAFGIYPKKRSQQENDAYWSCKLWYFDVELYRKVVSLARESRDSLSARNWQYSEALSAPFFMVGDPACHTGGIVLI
jgi:hypothetical protein